MISIGKYLIPVSSICYLEEGKDNIWYIHFNNGNAMYVSEGIATDIKQKMEEYENK